MLLSIFLKETLAIWGITVAAVILFYEAMRKVFMALYHGNFHSNKK